MFTCVRELLVYVQYFRPICYPYTYNKPHTFEFRCCVVASHRIYSKLTIHFRRQTGNKNTKRIFQNVYLHSDLFIEPGKYLCPFRVLYMTGRPQWQGELLYACCISSKFIISACLMYNMLYILENIIINSKFHLFMVIYVYFKVYARIYNIE